MYVLQQRAYDTRTHRIARCGLVLSLPSSSAPYTTIHVSAKNAHKVSYACIQTVPRTISHEAQKTKTCIKSKWQCWYGLLSLMLIWWILNIHILNSVHKFKCMYTTDSWLKEVAKSWRLWHGVLYYFLHFWYIFHILYSSIWIEPLIRNNFFCLNNVHNWAAAS